MDHVDGFTPAEYADRTARVRRELREQGIDVAVVLAPDSQYWLCGLESFISGVLTQALIVPAADDSETVLLMWDADLPIAHDTARSDRILTYRFGVDDPVALIGAELRAAVGTSAVVGLDAGSRAVPRAWTFVLTAVLLVNTALYFSVRRGERPPWREAYQYVWNRREAGDLVLGMEATVGEFYLAPWRENLRQPEHVQWLDKWRARLPEHWSRHSRRMWLVVNPEQFLDWDPADAADVQRFLREECRLVKCWPLYVESRDLSVWVYVRD